MKNLFLLFFLLLFAINSFAQCENVFTKNEGVNNVQTKASHWTVGKDFDCKLYFENTKNGLKAVIGIVEQREKFRMETGDQMMFYNSKSETRTLNFSKDATTAIGSKNKSTYVNELKLKLSDLDWFANNNITGVRFVNMVEMNSNTYRLHTTNSEIFSKSARCLLGVLDPSRNPSEMPGSAVRKEKAVSGKAKKAIGPDPDSKEEKEEQIKDVVKEEQIESTPSLSGQIWDLDDMLLSEDAAANKYKKLLENSLQAISDANLRAIALDIKIGELFFEQKRYSAAIPYLKNGLRKIETTNIGEEYKPRGEAMLASIYVNKKQYKFASAYNTNALGIWKNGCENEDDFELAYLAYLNQAKILKNVMATPANIALYEQSVSSSEKNWERALKTRGASAIKHQSDPDKSVDYSLALLSLQNAQDLIGKSEKGHQANQKIEIELELGALYFEAEDYTAAKKHYQNVLSLVKSNQLANPSQVAEANRMLSEISKKTNSYDDAMDYLEQVKLASLGRGGAIDESLLEDFNKIPQPIEVVYFIANQGSVVYNKNKDDVNEASLVGLLDDYDVATKLLHKIRKSHRNEGGKHRLGHVTDKLSREAILVCDKLYKATNKEEYLEKAFYYAELSKGGLLYEVVQGLESTNDIPKSEILKENGLKMQLAYLKDELLDEQGKTKLKDESRIKELEEQIASITKDYNSLLEEFEKKYPKYHSLRYDDQVLELKDLQKELQSNEVFLQYVAADSFVYVLAIGKDEVKSQLNKLSEPLRFTVRRLQIALKKNRPDFYEYNGLKLYESVIGDLASFIANKKLIIAPDAQLYYIPFGVLPVGPTDGQEKDENRYNKVHFLIQDYPICYNHSASAFLLSKKIKSTSSSQEIATWAPSFESMGEIIKAKGLGESLAPLPGAQKEANQIAAMFGASKTYIGGEATELIFKQSSSDYNVLHIATHGILNNYEPLASSLVLTNQDNEDGLLEASELYNMNLKANLAVLSACNSGMGKLSKDEGVVGVASAFAYAGVPNVVMSKWPVSDWSTQVLMKAFYNNLKLGMPKDEALQQAKLKYLEDNKKKPKMLAPFFWGSFVISGNNTPVDALITSGTSYWFYGAGILIVLLLLGRWGVLQYAPTPQQE